MIRPKDGVVRSVVLFDQGFETSLGMYNTGLRTGIQIVTNSRYVVLKFPTKKVAKEWNSYFKQIANSTARDFTSPNPHNSFAPTRSGALAKWFVDGSNYMSAVADALEGALEEIFIADWWLSPEIYMKRPTLDGEYWRLDKILLRKAVSKFLSTYMCRFLNLTFRNILMLSRDLMDHLVNIFRLCVSQLFLCYFDQRKI